MLLVPTIDGISLNAQPTIAFPFGQRPLVPHPCRGGDRGGESLAMKSNSIYFPKKKKNEKIPHHLTFPFETTLFKGLFGREVFSKEVTQHLT